MTSTDFSTFAECCKISGERIEYYKEVPIDALPLSVRIVNSFRKNRILTLADLLNMLPDDVAKIRGLGKNSLDELNAFCAKLSDNQISFQAVPQLEHLEISAVLHKYRDYIISGNFSFAAFLPEPEQKQVQIYQQAFQDLGPELVLCCVGSPEKIAPIFEALYEYQQTARRVREIRTMINGLPESRQRNKAIGYINAFTYDEDKRARLKRFWNSDCSLIAWISENALPEENNDQILLRKFLTWCTFDLREELETCFSALYRQKRTRTVLQLRAQKQTLEQVGEQFNITRERVRQIEATAIRHFEKLNRHIKILPKIMAETGRSTVLPTFELEPYAGEYMRELIFLLRSSKESRYIYDGQLDAFVVKSSSISEKLQSFVKTLPELIKAEEMSARIYDIEQDLGIPTELIENSVFQTYQKTGGVYHRGCLNRAVIYETIIRKYYPYGIKVYNSRELQEFRSYVYKEYGEIPVPENDRALAARITDICIMCGRGIYTAKKEQYMPNDLADRIYRYIEEKPQSVFLMNTIFAVFEEELLKADVDNKYYLQGILHELYGDLFTFRRDYISKDNSVTSIGSSIVEFIRGAQYPVSRAEIKAAFPGITDAVITFACDDADILNYFGSYLHAGHLSVLDEEHEILSNLLREALSDSETYHIKDFYEPLQSVMPDFFARNAIVIPFSAFSVLEYLFQEDYQFSRPYIGLNGIELGHPAERLHERLYSMDAFSVSDIQEFANENHMQIQSLLEFINSCNDCFLLIDSTTAMSISQIGITDKLANMVDALVSDSVPETVPICQLTIWNELPVLSVPWTDWLLYSVLNKWGTTVSVSTSSNQLRYAIPLVSPAGQMDIEPFRDLSKAELSAPFFADNLDDIDVLLEDLISDNILEEPL